MSRRITRSQTMCSARPPVLAFPAHGKRKSEPAKKLPNNNLRPIAKAAPTNCAEHLKPDSQQPVSAGSAKKTPNKAPKKSPHRRASTASTAREATITPVKSSKGKGDVVGTDKEKSWEGEEESTPAAAVAIHEDSDIPAKDVQQSDSASTLNSPRTLKTNPAALRKPSVPLRRSSRVALKPLPTNAVDTTASNETQQVSQPVQPVKIKQRRSTIHSAKSSSTEVFRAPAPNTPARRSSRVKSTLADIPSWSQTVQPVKIKQRRSSIHSNQTKPIVAKGTQKQEPNTETNAPKCKNPRPRSIQRNEVADSNAIVIPGDLKKVLLDDSFFINNQRKLYEMPHPILSSVAEVIAGYVALRKDDDSREPSISYLLHGIIEYFEQLIGTQLLYEAERVQYEVLLQNYPGVAMSKVYPPIYVLRLLVLLNKLVHFRNVEAKAFEGYVYELNKFAKYLAENKTSFFNSNISR